MNLKNFLLTRILSLLALALLSSLCFAVAEQDLNFLQLQLESEENVLVQLHFCFRRSPVEQPLEEEPTAKIICPSALFETYPGLAPQLIAQDVYKIPAYVDLHMRDQSNIELEANTSRNFLVSNINIVSESNYKKNDKHDITYSINFAYYFVTAALENKLCWMKHKYNGKITYLGEWNLIGSGAQSKLELLFANVLSNPLLRSFGFYSYEGWISKDFLHPLSLRVSKGEDLCDVVITAQMIQ